MGLEITTATPAEKIGIRGALGVEHALVKVLDHLVLGQEGTQDVGDTDASSHNTPNLVTGIDTGSIAVSGTASDLFANGCTYQLGINLTDFASDDPVNDYFEIHLSQTYAANIMTDGSGVSWFETAGSISNSGQIQMLDALSGGVNRSDVQNTGSTRNIHRTSLLGDVVMRVYNALDPDKPTEIQVLTALPRGIDSALPTGELAQQQNNTKHTKLLTGTGGWSGVRGTGTWGVTGILSTGSTDLGTSVGLPTYTPRILLNKLVCNIRTQLTILRA